MPVDVKTQELLRALGEAALRIADGQPITNETITDVLDRAASSDAGNQSLFTVTEACTQLRISRWSFYRLMHQRQINTVSIGRRRFVSHAEVRRFVTALNDGANA
ncbi:MULTISPECIES: helix-turn-helix domain-containing protein [Mycobacteriaceae]|nr:helix-turn-helix domain-containing protein [Mycolicibacterium conceptionense]MBN7505258.1 helix-turn-helix domain-containing protein [Mycobacteroides abscessus subsp. massiliense]SKK23519.1 DNA-binding protein, excisionase family [Mycobacteroides abscessus subsp. massiliense]SKW74111.1 DNA-binding protein, excisionase family [Mycobacteroides abscessus subsp. massiliense]